MPNIGLRLQAGPDHADFRSEIFDTWREAALPVEFMAGFSHRRAEGWMPVWPRTRQEVAVGDRSVYVPERNELRGIIESFGRPKDRERARLLSRL